MIKSIGILIICLSMLFLTACDVNHIKVKLTDFEYEATQNGFKIYSYNYTDIIISQDSNAARQMEYVQPSPAPPTSQSLDSFLQDNVTETDNSTKIIAEVENDTIKLTLG